MQRNVDIFLLLQNLVARVHLHKKLATVGHKIVLFLKNVVTSCVV